MLVLPGTSEAPLHGTPMVAKFHALFVVGTEKNDLIYCKFYSVF